MILRTYFKYPIKPIQLPTLTDKWYFTEITYFVVCDAVSAGIRNKAFVDETINEIYNWVEALIEIEDDHLIDLVAQHIYMRILEVFENRDFLAIINVPYEITECSARVEKNEKYVTFFLEYEVEECTEQHLR